MRLNVSAWAIDRPVPALMLFMLLTLAGLLGFQRLAVQDFPDIELPSVTVTVSLPGATPSQLETEVTRKVEDAVASLGKVEHITSTLTEGASSTLIEFSLEKDGREALDEVRDAVGRIRTQLPADVREPQVAKVTFGGLPVLTYSVKSASRDIEGLSWFVDSDVSKALLAVRDVANVTRQGGVEREIQVTLDETRLRAYGLTAAQVNQQLRAAQQELPAGAAEVGGQSQALRAVGRVQDVQSLREFVLPLGDGRSVRLSDIARIEDRHAPRSQAAFVNGEEVVSFQVFRARGASDVEVARAVREAVRALGERHPDVALTEVADNVERVNRSYAGSMKTLYEGAVLAVLVVWLFLRDWRATVVSAVALPLSVIPTFVVMQQFGFTLNTVTLLALTLVVGILVDDAIVEVENIVRHQRMGKSALVAAREAAQEIGLAVVATTMTLVAVFLPTAFMGGIPGKFFVQFGWTAAVSVLFSLLVARMLTPMMAAYLLGAPPAHKEGGRLSDAYLRTVRACIAHPWRTLGAALLFMAGSVALMSRVPTEFMPASDQSRIIVNVELPPGSLLADTTALAQSVRERIASLPEVERIYTAVGAGGLGGRGAQAAATPEARQATLTVMLPPPEARARTQAQVESDIRGRLADVPGARITLGYGASGEKYSVTLAGEDPVQLAAAAQAVEDDLRSLPGLGAVSSSASLLRPEVVITPRAQEAARAGVTVQSLSQLVRLSTAGDYDTGLSKLNAGARQLPIRVRLEDDVREDLETLAALRVPSASGSSVALSSVADLRIDSGPAQIARKDRQRYVNVSVELNGARLGEVAARAAKLPALAQLPPDVKLLPSGDLERMKSLFSSFGLAMGAGVLCVYVVLVLLFHSFAQPLTILAALPLSAGGAFGLLALFGYSMSMPVLIGLLMLMGIVTKNSILLVEYAIVAQHEQGLGRLEAMLDACSKRARPILMTTVAMVAGMLPIALGYNGDKAFRSPMATAVIGGLITSTLLSLLVVPVVYDRVEALKAWLAQRLRRAG